MPTPRRPVPPIPRGITERFPGVFQVNITWKGKRLTGTAHSLPDAIALRSLLLDQLKTGVDSRGVWTLAEAVERTYRACWTDARSAHQLHDRALEAADFFGPETPITQVTSTKVDAWILSLQKRGNAGATINRKIAALSKVLTHARKCADVSGFVLRPHLERQREGEGRIRFLSDHEETTILSLLHQWGKLNHRDAVIVLLDTGLRPSELWRLQAQDVNLTNGVLTVWQTKNRNPRSVPMTQRVRTLLEHRINQFPSGQVFPGTSNQWLRRGWDRVKIHMKLTQDAQFIPYCLRHTCASRLVQRGIHLRVVQEWMGHKTLSVTMRYAHLSPANLLEAVKVLDR